MIKLDAIEIRWLSGSDTSPLTSILGWQAPDLTAEKGILHAPAKRPTIRPDARDALLEAIAKARLWIDDLVEGRVHSLAEIAQREGKVERHVRLLAPLAFVSPQLISMFIDGTAPREVTVTDLAVALPYTWVQQLVIN